MQDVGDQLVVEPRHLSRRARRLAGCLLTLLLTICSLTSATPSPGCSRATTPPSPHPWLAADDPFVRNLHYAALDRARTTADNGPNDVRPADVRRATRKLGAAAGVSVYLASGSDFACLGADGRPAHDHATTVCILNSTIANQGLSTTIGSEGADAPILVVAVPDGAAVVTGPTTEHLADDPNVAVLRPHHDQVLLQQPGRPPIVLNPYPDASDDDGPPC